MKEDRCLYCYQPLPKGVKDLHEECSLAFFGTPVPPLLDYSNEQMKELAKEIVIRSVAVTGVQPKLSLTIEKDQADPKRSRFTLVGLWGNYILKPPTDTFPNLPENEDLTMHLAAEFGIPTAKHSLIRLRSGELAYITKRFDRITDQKLPLEDMCQLTETLTSNKYRSSLEKIGKCIDDLSTAPGLDKITFFETALFCFLTGNADMHLKNFSLLTTEKRNIVLSPAYDLVATKIAIPEDKDETALTINGKKRKLKRSDLESLAASLRIPERSTENSFAKFAKSIHVANEWIAISFLPDKLKKEYTSILSEASSKMELT